MAVLMAEDKSKYNDMNTIYMKWTLASHSLSGYRFDCTLFYKPLASPQAKMEASLNE